MYFLNRTLQFTYRFINKELIIIKENQKPSCVTIRTKLIKFFSKKKNENELKLNQKKK